MSEARAFLPKSSNRAAPLASFGRPIRAVVIGASGGSGNALVSALARSENVESVQALSRAPTAYQQTNVKAGLINIEDENSIAASANRVASQIEKIDLIVVATGILHDGTAFQPEKSWKSLNPEKLERAFKTNTIGPVLVAKHFLPLLNRKSKAVFAALSARVGSIEDNRLGGWYGYRASKSALNMSIRNLAIELTRTHPYAICLALHPGTVDTNLSRPFMSSVRNGFLQDTETCANNLLNVMNTASSSDTGSFFDYNGTRLPY